MIIFDRFTKDSHAGAGLQILNSSKTHLKQSESCEMILRERFL